MKIFITLILVAGLTGCAGLRITEINTNIKDGEYGIARGRGNVILRTTTKWCFLCKEIIK